MSNIKKHQNWYKKELNIVVYTDNNELSAAVKERLTEHFPRNASKHIAHDLDLNLYTVRNWFNKNTGLKAYDLLKLLDNYDFIRNFLGFRKFIPTNRITGKKNREEIRKKIINLLSKNPEMTMNDLALELKITPKSVEWRLCQLVKERRIRRIGATKNGKWLVRE